MHLFYKK